MKRWISIVIAGMMIMPAATQAADSFVTFESGQVRPLALSADGTRLYSVNTPDNRLEIYNVDASGLTHQASVPVGMEPVAVAEESSSKVWVVNHLSDSVSIVDVSLNPPRVVRTLPVGDEPRDIVFAGTTLQRAFITTAHRGQNSPVKLRPNARTGRADVWVFDVANLATSPRNRPLTIVTLFGDTPRALAVSADKSTVYAAVFNSGNKSTVLATKTVLGDTPPPKINVERVQMPVTALIVKQQGGQWLDDAGRDWSDKVRVQLPDFDVFGIDADAAKPVQTSAVSGVGTVLFNMAVNPANGKIYVSNLESRNLIRFEGPGEFASFFGASTVRGHIAESRISIIDGGVSAARHLNKHIDYDTFPGTPEENSNSLAFPTEMAFNQDGSQMYVTALGSSKVGIFDTTKLEDDSFIPDSQNHIELSSGGPTGLVLDGDRNRLYVMTRFGNSITVVDLATRSQIDEIRMYNPEPASVVNGRPLLYDARYTSSRGDSACASCHIFGDMDHLAWDLGNPDDVVKLNPNPFVAGDGSDGFHPMKGPMTTQSLRGLANQGPQHWRGDRTGGNDPQSGDPLDEEAAFKAFDVAFEGLLGRAAPLTDAEMQAFTDFALQITYPPNPVRALDNSLNESETRGRDIYFNQPFDRGGQLCNDCHVLDPQAGFFGTAGLSVAGQLAAVDTPQAIKVPHLRNIYTKLGFIGASAGSGAPSAGPQIRGFGLGHEGSIDTILNFFRRIAFLFDTDQQRVDIGNFVMAMDSNLAPIVGQQVTVNAENQAIAAPIIDLMIQRAGVTLPRPECSLIVKGVVAGEQRGWLHIVNGLFKGDRAGDMIIGRNGLMELAKQAGQDMTFTCVPPGTGARMALDRDEDGHFDRDELDAGSDPADPTSIPQGA